MKIETYRKRAKQLVRWHREGNHSVGGKVRLLARYAGLTDAEVLAAPLPLGTAQEIVAVEAGFATWRALRDGVDGLPERPRGEAVPRLGGAVPILFVRDVAAAAAFYAGPLGFRVDFLHGEPPFYGSVSRDGARLHLRFVPHPTFADVAEREVSLVLATVEVANVKGLFAEWEASGVTFVQRLTSQAWGGLDFQIRDPDGNRLSFVEYRA